MQSSRNSPPHPALAYGAPQQVCTDWRQAPHARPGNWVGVEGGQHRLVDLQPGCTWPRCGSCGEALGAERLSKAVMQHSRAAASLHAYPGHATFQVAIVVDHGADVGVLP